MPEFLAPTADLQATFLDAMAEFAAEGRSGDGSGIGSDLDAWTGPW